MDRTAAATNNHSAESPATGLDFGSIHVIMTKNAVIAEVVSRNLWLTN
jgi:hypothetical protein